MYKGGGCHMDGDDFSFGEQRDPHGEGSHLNASKADFFDNTGQFFLNSFDYFCS